MDLHGCLSQRALGSLTLSLSSITEAPTSKLSSVGLHGADNYLTVKILNNRSDEITTLKMCRLLIIISSSRLSFLSACYASSVTTGCSDCAMHKSPLPSEGPVTLSRVYLISYFQNVIN